MQRAALRDVIVCCICREVGFRGHALFDKKERLHLTMRQRLRAHKFQTLHLGSIVQTGLLHLPPEEFATPGGSITPTSSQPWLEAHIDHAGLSLALELRPIANWIEVCEVAGGKENFNIFSRFFDFRKKAASSLTPRAELSWSGSPRNGNVASV